VEERILEFVRSLRNRGVPVSTAESIDALSAVEAAGMEDPEVFRASLKAALVKTRKDGAVFDELFPLYFYGLEGSGEVAAPDEELLARLERELQAMAAQNGHNPLLMLLLAGRGGEFESFIRAAAGAVGTSQLVTRMQVGMYTRRIFDSFDWEKMEEDFRELQSRLREAGWTEEELEELERIYQANREALRRQVRRYVEREQARNLDRIPSSERVDRLMLRPLASLDEQELQQMRRAVDVLAASCATSSSCARSGGAGTSWTSRLPCARTCATAGSPSTWSCAPSAWRRWSSWCSATSPPRWPASPSSCSSSCTPCRIAWPRCAPSSSSTNWGKLLTSSRRRISRGG
jgi:uncharacterized protein with von Willebrand factor type A (vWA) domain